MAESWHGTQERGKTALAVPSLRHRLGVALLLDPPTSAEVDGLRRGVGDPLLGSRALYLIPPHVTLVSPVNVRHEELGNALRHLRAAAAGVDGPLTVEIGPPRSFLPANPVLYLQVRGDLDRMGRLREELRHPPFLRPDGWPWVPHVTLVEGIDPAKIPSALSVLTGYHREAIVDRVVLLEQQSGPAPSAEGHSGLGGRRWVPIADARLGAGGLIGRGGLAIELVDGRLVDPEGLALLRQTGVELPALATDAPTRPPIVVTGRREGVVAGLACAWRDDDGSHVAVVVGRDFRRQGIGSHLLAYLERVVSSAGWTSRVLHAIGPSGFYSARSRWSRADS
ncbi:MAG: GNAT family N-acetyltransferase [Actinomycetota bacterium]|nr:GNAT family N-acetyltransferase [Actinomycetota bacterium]